MMTPIEGITAPARAATLPPIPLPTATLCPADDGELVSSRRQAGWSAANQRLFLEGIAEGHGVEAATARVGLSAASAYAFRRTAKGATFALGWRAATLVARDAIAETLLVRALVGQVDTYTRADGSIVTRHRHDNRLAMSLLARLDRQTEAAPDADAKAARLVAQEFDAFLDLVARDEGAARAGLFLARAAMAVAELTPSSSPGRPRGPHEVDLRGGTPAGQTAPFDVTGFTPVAATGISALLAPIYALAAADRLVRTGVATAGEVDIADLDPRARVDWTAEQWQRAEAAGLMALAVRPQPQPEPEPARQSAPAPQHPQHSDDDDPDSPVWWDDNVDEWRTSFPPPAPDLVDYEDGEPDRVEYERSLTEAEAAVMGRGPNYRDAAELAALAVARDAWFAAAAPPATPVMQPPRVPTVTPPSQLGELPCVPGPS